MSLPFDVTRPESRPASVTFYTDEVTGQWLERFAETHGLDRSLLVHRIVKAAREAATAEGSENSVS